MEKVNAGWELMERWRAAGVSNSDEWSSKGKISGDARWTSWEVLDLEA